MELFIGIVVGVVAVLVTAANFFLARLAYAMRIKTTEDTENLVEAIDALRNAVSSIDVVAAYNFRLAKDIRKDVDEIQLTMKDIVVDVTDGVN
jgi:hypothetical protein